MKVSECQGEREWNVASWPSPPGCPFGMLPMHFQAITELEVMDKRFLSFLLFSLFESSALNAVSLLWRRKANPASERKHGGCGFPVQLCQGFPGRAGGRELIYSSASSHVPARLSWVRGMNEPWQQPCRKAWKTSSSEEFNGKLLA